MKKLATTFGVLALLALAAAPSFAANAVRISQFYGGGGGGAGNGATYNQDYVEIFNNSGAAVNIGGWTIEYGSATGNWGSSATNIFTFPANTFIQPCKYILVAQGTPSLGGANLPIAADFTGSIGASATSGKIGLFTVTTSPPVLGVACGAEAAGTLVDKLSYGTGNCPEVTNVAALSVTTGAVRNGGGTVDTDNNVNNFTVVTNPVPRNSASTANATCLSTPTTKSTWGSVKSIYR